MFSGLRLYPEDIAYVHFSKLTPGSLVLSMKMYGDVGVVCNAGGSKNILYLEGRRKFTFFAEPAYPDTSYLEIIDAKFCVRLDERPTIAGSLGATTVDLGRVYFTNNGPAIVVGRSERHGKVGNYELMLLALASFDVIDTEPTSLPQDTPSLDSNSYELLCLVGDQLIAYTGADDD